MEIYVLARRWGVDLNGVSVSTNLKELQKQMRNEYHEAIIESDPSDKEYEESYFKKDCAYVSSYSDCYEWKISKHTIEV